MTAQEIAILTSDYIREKIRLKLKWHEIIKAHVQRGLMKQLVKRKIYPILRNLQWGVHSQDFSSALVSHVILRAHYCTRSSVGDINNTCHSHRRYLEWGTNAIRHGNTKLTVKIFIPWVKDHPIFFSRSLLKQRLDPCKCYPILNWSLMKATWAALARETSW